MVSAAKSGVFSIGGKAKVHRLGFGAMRTVGDGVWGPPKDKAEAMATLRRVPELGVDFIDTADAYGPDISEELLREALYPYDGLLIATKGGLTRSGPNQWAPKGDPGYLIGAAKKSRERLKVESIALWQLHRIDPAVPRDEQFGAIKSLLDDGVIAQAGLSEVSVEEIEAARKVFPVVTVQNQYNLVTRGSEDVLDYCEKHNIGFIPWFPLAAGKVFGGESPISRLAAKSDASPSQLALAWLLARSPVILPIPGTSKVDHLEENVAAAALKIDAGNMEELDRVA